MCVYFFRNQGLKNLFWIRHRIVVSNVYHNAIVIVLLLRLNSQALLAMLGAFFAWFGGSKM